MTGAAAGPASGEDRLEDARDDPLEEAPEDPLEEAPEDLREDPRPEDAPAASDGPAPSVTGDLPEDVRGDREANLRRVRQVAVALTVVGLVVGLPVGVFTVGLGHLGLCWEGCTPGEEVLMLLFAGVPIAYVVFATRWVRRLRQAAQDESSQPPPISPAGIAWAAVVASVLLVLAFVATCFAILGIASGAGTA